MELLGKYKTIYTLDAVKKYFYVYRVQVVYILVIL